jgi:hypothetical protein
VKERFALKLGRVAPFWWLGREARKGAELGLRFALARIWMLMGRLLELGW